VVCRNSRLCQEDIIIDGLKIPKGAHVDIPLYGMLRDSEYWDEPLKFKPERYFAVWYCARENVRHFEKFSCLETRIRRLIKRDALSSGRVLPSGNVFLLIF